MRYWIAEHEDLRAIEREFLRHVEPGGSVIVRGDAWPDVDPDGRFLVLWWDGVRVHRWQGDDRVEWVAVWRRWHAGHRAVGGAGVE